jgi:3alpha(or 20beta)-hydroxysteroid dehydrogenase
VAVAVAVAAVAVGDPAAHTTTHRAGRPEEIAPPVILFLVRADSSFVTGSEPVIDGGLTAH